MILSENIMNIALRTNMRDITFNIFLSFIWVIKIYIKRCVPYDDFLLKGSGGGEKSRTSTGRSPLPFQGSAIPLGDPSVS